jgi:hypothetical protein
VLREWREEEVGSYHKSVDEGSTLELGLVFELGH